MQDDHPNKVDLNWSPPQPPFEPEPEPLDLGAVEEEQTTEETGTRFNCGGPIGLPNKEQSAPSRIHNGDKASPEFSEFDSKDNGIRVGDFFFYMIMSPQGITRNGVFYDIGGHWFDEETYGSIEIIDLPFQE